MLKKKKMKLLILVFILIMSLILPTTMGYAVELETIQITEDTDELKQIQSSRLNVTVKNDGSYGAILDSNKGMFFGVYSIGDTSGNTMKLIDDFDKDGSVWNYRFGMNSSNLNLEDFSMEDKTIKVSKVNPGVARYTLRTSIVNATAEGGYMKLEMEMENLKDTPQNMGMILNWDTKVNGNDASPFKVVPNGWANFYNGVQVSAFLKDTMHTTNADGIAFGDWGSPRMTWEEHESKMDQQIDTRDGFADAWYDPIEVASGASRKISVIIGAGPQNEATVLSETNMSSIDGGTYSPGESISLTGKVTDSDDIGNIVDVMCSVGDNDSVKLGTLDLSSGAKTFDYTYELPNDLTPGENTLKLWAIDSVGIASNLESANITIPTNNDPSISINDSSKDIYYNSEKITVTGSVYDDDNDDVTVSASIGSHTVTDTVYGGDGNWTLEWDIDDLDILDDTYTDIVVTADDGNSGTDTENYSGDLIVDTIKPSGNISTDASGYTKGEVTLTLAVSDEGGSGVRKVQRPDNKWIVRLLSGESASDVVSGTVYEAVYSSIDEVEYTVTQNDKYKFLVEDFAGNQNEVAVNINNIDKTVPTAELTLSTDDWTNQTVSINVYAVDNGQSGIKRIKLPNNTWVNSSETVYNVSENGTYNFLIENNVGNQNTVSISVTNIDKSAPAKPVIEKTPEVDNYTGKYTISITGGEDNGSGVKETLYRLSGVSEKAWTKYENQIEVVAVGKTTIEAKTIDHARNESQTAILEVNITKKSSSSSGGSSTSLKDVDGDLEVDKTNTKPSPTINLSQDRDGKAPVSLKTIKEMKEANKTIVVENNGVKIGFKPDSIQATQIKEELEQELNKELTYESVEVILGANEVIDLEKEKIIKKANLGETTGLFEVGGKVFDLTANLVKEKNGVKTEEKIKHFNEPVEVTLELKGLDLTKKDIEKLTAIRYEKDEKGNIKPVKLGGKYDPVTKSFTFYTDTFSLYSVVKADDMLEIDLSIGKLEAEVNKEIKENDVAPKIINDRTMVPVRFIAENMGAEVTWNAETRKVTIELDGQTMSMVIDKEIEGFDTPPTIIEGRTLVPVRYVSEKLGAYVMWFSKDKRVRIVK